MFLGWFVSPPTMMCRHHPSLSSLVAGKSDVHSAFFILSSNITGNAL
jgi:hypothetical protein